MIRITLLTIVAATLAIDVTQADEPPRYYGFGMNVSLQNHPFALEGQKALYINYTFPGSIAEKAGLEAGMWITHSNGHDFNTAETDFQAVGILRRSIHGGGGYIGPGAPSGQFAKLSVIEHCGLSQQIECWVQLR